MKLKKVLSAVLAAAMLLSTMSFTVFAEGEVAEVNGTQYATLLEAVDAANDGDTIKMIADYTVATEVGTKYEMPANSVLDLNGNTLNIPSQCASFTGTNITIKNGTFKLSPVVSPGYSLYIAGGSATVDSVTTHGVHVSGGANVTLKDVKSDASASNKSFALYAAGTETSVKIKGDQGYYRSGNGKKQDVYSGGATIEIYAGEFYYKNKLDASFIPEGYVLVDTGKATGSGKVVAAYTVTFYANGGEGTMADQVVLAGETVNLAANEFTKTGYVFKKWTTAADGTGAAYAEGDAYSDAANLELYAQWTPAVYNINYELNGGTNEATAPTTHTYGTATTLPTPTHATKTFLGWYTDAACANTSRVVGTLGAEDYTADITLYAKWGEPATITSGIEVRFEKVESDEYGKTYDIVLASNSALPFNRLTTADLTFLIVNDDADKTDVSYAIVAKEGTNISVNNFTTDALGSTRTEFNYNGTGDADSGKISEITIGQVKFEGYGKFIFKVNATNSDIVKNFAVHGTTEEDNKVTTYTTTGTDELIINENVLGGKGIIDTTLEPKKYDLTINVAFNNGLRAAAGKDYKGMNYTISGGDLEAPITGKFGVWNGKTDSVVAPLSENTTYTVTLEADGYRTAKYTVSMTEDKTLNFWNNVKTLAAEVEAGKATSAVTKNFLAGDIVNDSQINIYDLSAVVSYFGVINGGEDLKYAKYDLNRDGKIDTTDVAMVLVSWGN